MAIGEEIRGPARPVPTRSPSDFDQPPQGFELAGQDRVQSFERTPPQDVAAEQSVLGGMLLSKDAIADVIEILRTADFYRPAHATIFDAVLDLYGRGEPADAVTVAAALDQNGDLARVGGAPYLHTLLNSVPTAANAAYYARIVGERAILRRLVEAGTKIVQLGYGSAAGTGRDVDDIVDLAQQAIYDVTERRVSEDFSALGDLLQPTLDEIEAVGATGGMMSGIPTGFQDLDRLLNGLHPGQLIIVAGRPGLGKALALDTPLATPSGWTTMGDVRVGDVLLGADGRPTRVTAATEVLTGRPCFEVEFSDGSVIVADALHRWVTSTRAERRADRRTASVRTTEEIAATLHCRTGDQRPNHSIAATAALDLPEARLPLPPYALGVWLGDGDSAEARFASVDPEIAMYVEAEGLAMAAGTGTAYTMRLSTAPLEEHESGVTAHLRGLDVLNDKHIPLAYLRGSQGQRRALLAGLLDTRGRVRRDGSARLSVAGRRFADDVFELVATLGYQPQLGRTTMQGGSTAYTITFSASDAVFRLERKRIAHKERLRAVRGGRSARFVVDVRPIPSVPVRCVEVDNADHLFLAGRALIPTHNSTAGMDFARSAALKHSLASAIFSLEMSKVEIVTRLLSAEARVPMHVLRSGQLSDDDWTKLARRMGEISEAPLFVDDTPNMNLMEIRAKARRLKQRHDLKLIVVDYLQLMTSPKRVESRQQEVADLSRGLKLLAKEVECPVIAVSQLNRGPEQRTDKRPQLSDLRESGCLTADTRLIRADDNSEVTLGELLATGATDVAVWALDESLKYAPRTMTHVFPSGHREVFRMTLASGKQIDATANHPFLTVAGWLPLGELSTGDRLATPRHVPPPLDIRPWAEPEVVMLAHLLGGGSFAARQSLRYASADEENLEAVTLAAKHWDVAAVRDERAVPTLRLPVPYRVARGRRDPLAAWLDGLGLFGLGSHGKFIPAGVFALPKDQVTLFLHHLWATDGCVTVSEDGCSGLVRLSSPSRRLLEDVSRLLLRYGITAGLRREPGKGRRPRYALDISGRDDQLRFLREIGVHGGGSAGCAALLTVLEQAATGTAVDGQVWDRVREVLTERSMSEVLTERGMSVAGTASRGGEPAGRHRLTRVAEVLDAADLDLHATNDIFWDEIVSIESRGEQDVFDATVTGTHNFIANGIATHNSIEQDADVVILLHRDDYYDKESPRAGEADFIVAKHRNGPTDTITVAAQLHMSRFIDMAVG